MNMRSLKDQALHDELRAAQNDVVSYGSRSHAFYETAWLRGAASCCMQDSHYYEEGCSRNAPTDRVSPLCNIAHISSICTHTAAQARHGPPRQIRRIWATAREHGLWTGLERRQTRSAATSARTMCAAYAAANWRPYCLEVAASRNMARHGSLMTRCSV
jgi:hypothetical protein